MARFIDQRKAPPIAGLWVSLGEHGLEAGRVAVTVSKESGGHLIIDAVQAIRVD